jgi:dTDP-4-dehydrorhamnose reductase
MREKIIIAGASGYIGEFLSRRLSQDGHKIKPLDRTHGCDIRNKQNVANLFADFMPTVVIDCLDFGTLKEVQENQEKASSVIVGGANTLAGLAKIHDAYIIQMSTSYVFAGNGIKHNEFDTPKPFNAYAALKLIAESACHKSGLILRMSGVYGYKREKSDNLDLWAISEWKKGSIIKAFELYYSTPTFIGDLADVVSNAIKSRATDLYHVAGPDRMNRYDFFLKLAERMGHDWTCVVPSREIDGLRPLDGSLDSSLVQRELGVEMHDVRDGMLLADY